ncbi:MAG: NAD(P)H-dependent oxidoreductase subunit E [Candidatus Aminicenantes bacterium]|nr:NAD(P)H-dependent oxidoreductase subunit E [Candidatus Aminicenantes bacterium]
MKFNKIDKILEKFNMQKSQLISILQDIQNEFNFLPMEVLGYVAEKLGIPFSLVYHLATFYKTFSLKRRGRHLINVCLGTACHIRGGVRILEKIERDLNIKSGSITLDSKFSLEVVRCVGCCSLAPVIRIDDDTHGRLTQGKITPMLKKYE